MSEATRKQMADPKAREVISLANRGKHFSDETRAKLSIARRKRITTEETRAKMSATQKARMASPEVKEKARSAGLGRALSEETRAKISAANKGKMRSAEVRSECSLRMKVVMSDPEMRKRVCAGSREWMRTPAGRSKFSEATRSAYAKDPSIRERQAFAMANYMAQWPKPKTNLEYALAGLLDSLGLVYEEQKRFGRYVVDAYVPVMNTAYEADGSYWHQDKEREIRRDVYLKARGIKEIVHLTDVQLLRR